MAAQPAPVHLLALIQERTTHALVRIAIENRHPLACFYSNSSSLRLLLVATHVALLNFIMNFYFPVEYSKMEKKNGKELYDKLTEHASKCCTGWLPESVPSNNYKLSLELGHDLLSAF